MVDISTQADYASIVSKYSYDFSEIERHSGSSKEKWMTLEEIIFLVVLGLVGLTIFCFALYHSIRLCLKKLGIDNICQVKRQCITGIIICCEVTNLIINCIVAANLVSHREIVVKYIIGRVSVGICIVVSLLFCLKLFCMTR